MFEELAMRPKEEFTKIVYWSIYKARAKFSMFNRETTLRIQAPDSILWKGL